MENLTEQLENIIIADSGPTNLSLDFSHIHSAGVTDSQAVIPCTLVDSGTGTVVGILDYKHDGSASIKIISIVLNFCGSDAVKSKSGKGSVFVESVTVTEAGKGVPDFHGFQVEILEDPKGETLYQATDARSLDAKSNTASDRVLGGTRLVAKYIGSEPRLYEESGEGETFKSTELGILESKCDYLTARSLCSTRLVAKFTGSQPGIKHLAAGQGSVDGLITNNTNRDDGSTIADGHLVGGNVVVKVKPISGKGKTPQRSDVPSPDSESNTPQEDADSQEGKVEGSSMESLPTEIVQEIISRVPAESVLGCKLVCKKWVALICGRNFANMHLARLLDRLLCNENSNSAAEVESCLFFACRADDPDEFRTLLFHGGQVSDGISIDKKYIYSQNLKRIHHPPMHQDPMREHLVGSCNGLVCAFQEHHLTIDPIYICNPLTREYVHLPRLFVNKEDVEPYRVMDGEVNMLGNVAGGFGYVRSTNEYKVVRVHYLSFTEGNVEVYTLGSGCGWRSIGKVFYRLNTSCSGKGAYLSSNDAIYWISYNKIVAFDLAKEEFRLLSVPPRLENRGKEDRCGLVVLGRHLCLYVDDRSRVQIWSLNSKEIWHMEFDIDYEAAVVDSRKNEFKPILLTKDGELVFLYAETALYCYDSETKKIKMISNEASADHFEAMEAIVHMNTFVSLEAIGENSNRFTVLPLRLSASRDDVIHELDRVALDEECSGRGNCSDR